MSTWMILRRGIYQLYQDWNRKRTPRAIVSAQAPAVPHMGSRSSEGSPYSLGNAFVENANMIAAQSDLFEQPGPMGLTQAEAIVTGSEEQSLIASIDKVQLSPFR